MSAPDMEHHGLHRVLRALAAAPDGAYRDGVADATELDPLSALAYLADLHALALVSQAHIQGTRQRRWTITDLGRTVLAHLNAHPQPLLKARRKTPATKPAPAADKWTGTALDTWKRTTL